MANGKKWYSYFVSVEDDKAPTVSTAGKSDAAKAVADIAKSIQVPAAQTQRIEQKLQSTAVQLPTQAATAGSKSVSFDEIYSAAEIAPPPHGYTIVKVADMLASTHIQGLPAEVKRNSVLLALDAAGVKIQEVVEDAIRRDKALDTFERLQQKQIEEFEVSKLEENRKLQAELDKLAADYRTKIQANNESVARRKESFYAWKMEKQKMEQKIADAVSPFVTENPITTSSQPVQSISPGKTGI